MQKITNFIKVIGFKCNLPVVQCDGKNYKNTSKMEVQIQLSPFQKEFILDV